MTPPLVAIERDASPAEIAALRARLARIAALAASAAPAGPFLLVTPLGLERRDAIAQALSAAGIALGAERTPIPRFTAAATALYVRSAGDEALHRALAFERLWDGRWEGIAGERWALASDEAFARLVEVKREVRAGFPSWEARVTTPRRGWTVSLHAFHVPDAGRVEVEAKLLAACLVG